MKIGQFTDSFLPVVDGVGRVVSNYAREMGARGETCYVVTPRQESNLPQTNETAYKLLTYRSVNLPVARQYRVGMPAFDPKYRQELASLTLDIAHAHDPFSAGREALRLSQQLHIPLVTTFHSDYYQDFLRYTGSKTLAQLGIRRVLNFYRQCDQVWTVSQSAAETLRGYGYQGTIEVVPNGTDRREHDPAAVDMVNERFGLGSDPVLFFAGQMDWKKNIRRILETVAMLKQEGHSVRLLMAGQGPDEQAIRSLAADLGLGERVHFTGHIKDERVMAGLYQRASLFFFPSLYDTAGLVVSEAAALGTPSLLAAGSAAAESVQDGVNGLIAADTTEAMAERIVWALEHPAQLERIGLAARDTIPRAWSEVIDEVLRRYAALIGEKQA